jgi:hypothetical protein
MTLKLALLRKVKHRPGKIIAQCPACAETGGDTKGVHLVVFSNGKFGCTANPKGKAHRRRIAQLAGDPERTLRPWTLKLRLTQHHPVAGTPITSLARGCVKNLNATTKHPSELPRSDTSDDQKPIAALGDFSTSVVFIK